MGPKSYEDLRGFCDEHGISIEDRDLVLLSAHIAKMAAEVVLEGECQDCQRKGCVICLIPIASTLENLFRN